jgi:hypothetical protein
VSWKLGAVVVTALLVPIPRAIPTEPKAAPAVAPVSEAPAPEPQGRAVTPIETWSSARDARSLACDDDFVWIATGGGLDRYARATRERRHFGVESGLDTLDVRSVESATSGLVVSTATSRCSLSGDRFLCKAAPPAKAQPANLTLFQGHPVAARVRVGSDAWIATRGGGAFFVPGDDATKAIALTATSSDPAGFIHTGTVFRGSLWLGTFDDGLYRVPLGPDGKPTGPLASTALRMKSPVRLVNRIVATTGKDAALFVGASEGLFVSRDGVKLVRVEAIAPNAVTGLAATDRHLWVTTTEALYRLPVSGQGPVQRSFVRPGGSHAIQAVAVDARGSAWLATEDRGVVRVDDDRTIHGYDRVAGLPSSWFVAIDTDGAGGAIASSLRHGAVRIARDGSWSPLAWAPSPWGLGVRHDRDRTCLATQGGARCETKGGELETLVSLPDPRVHTFIPLGDSVLVGTEAGAAVFPL